MAATDYSSLYKLCDRSDTVGIPAIQSLLSSSSPSTRTQFFSYQDIYCWTPLHAACHRGHHQVVEMLLAAGANKDTPDKNGSTPLYVACRNGHQVVELLLTTGAYKETPRNDGQALLNVACRNGHYQVVEMLLASGATKEIPSEYGWTPLFTACQYGHHQVVEILLAAGASKATPTNDGCTPLLVACKAGYHQVVEVLLRYGANPETKDAFGFTLLWNACLRPHNLAMIRMLLYAGASIYCRNQIGVALLQDPSIRQEHRDILFEHHRNISLFHLLWTWYQRSDQLGNVKLDSERWCFLF